MMQGPSTSSARLSTPLRRSLAVQVRVIGALLMREVLTRYGRHNIGFLWLFAEPMIFTLGIAALWSAFKVFHASDIPIVAFALTGYSSVLLWRNMPARCIGALAPNLSLMYHRNVKAMDVYAARLILEAMGATVSFIVLSLLFIGLEWIKPPEDLVKVLFGWLLLAAFGCAFALFLGVLGERTEIIEKLWHPASYLLFPLSGAAFLVDALPPGAQQVLLLLPMVHGVELVRDGYFGSHFHPHYNVLYLVSVIAGLALLALAELRTLGTRVTPE